MAFPRFALLLGSLLVATVAAQAGGKLATSNSNYGFGDFGTDNQTPSSTCLNLDSITCLLTEQTFYATESSSLAVYDFKINSDLSNFALTLDGNAQLFSSDAFGAFICDTTHPENPVQCGPDATSLATATALADGQGAKFTVPGDGKGLVFFVALNKPVAADPPPNPTDVTASIQVGTPEPDLFPILGLAGVAVLAFRRRRVTG